MLLRMLQNEAHIIQMKITDADLDIGMARALVKSNGLNEEVNTSEAASDQSVSDFERSDN